MMQSFRKFTLLIGLLFVIGETTNAQWMQTNGPYGGSILYLAVSGDNIFAGTKGYGVWRRPLSEMVEVSNARQPSEMPNQVSYKIGTFSYTGTNVIVEFTLTHSDIVNVTMYDFAGKEIASLVNQHLDAGSYRYYRDIHAFAQGCYAVRLQAGANVRTGIVQIVH